MSPKTNSPEILWDFGTAYELFISLHVLHMPDHFGIRPAYAAGVRSRIPAAERKLLEEIMPFVGIPFGWIHRLPAPKDAISVLWALKQTPPAERMPKLFNLGEVCELGTPEETEKHLRFNNLLSRIVTEGRWQPDDADFLMEVFKDKHSNTQRERIERYLQRWSKPAEFGEEILSAMQAYYQAFFEEEEKRITPILKAGLEHAQSLAQTLSFDELTFELSQGVRLGKEEETNLKQCIFTPAFWTTPLIFFERLDKDTLLIAFGTRPAEMSVIPGESLPDGLVRSLKALADPTRLKILFYLSHEGLTPTELARRLHLRAPTVTHHLNELRLASLVNLTTEGQERKYTARRETLQTTFTNLQEFLK